MNENILQTFLGANAQNTGDCEDAIANIISFGLLSEKQGAEIRKILGDLAEKRSENAVFAPVSANAKQNGANASSESPQTAEEMKNAFFKVHSALLNSDAGALLKEYLKEAGGEDYEKIGKILEEVAKNAVEAYIKKVEYEKNLYSANEDAKKKLKTYSSQGTRNKGEAKKVYTREEIGRMSAEEFARAHDQIMDDFVNGRVI